jgi:membrane protease YdiL (CAAX protease family)
VAISLLPGFSEEIIFRGIIQGTYGKSRKAAKAILFSSLFFMLMHGDISSFTYTFAAGVILGLVYYVTGSLWAAVIYHTVNNFIGVAANYIYSIFGLGEMISTNYEILPQSADIIITVIVLFGLAAVCLGICVLLFWGLTKVSKNPRQEIQENIEIKKVEYVPYIVGGFLMLIVAVLPVAVEMIRR